MAQLLVFQHFARGAIINNRAGIKDNRAIGQVECSDGVLFHDDGCDALFADQVQGFLDFLHNNRCQTLIGLIKQQQLEIAGQRTADGQHLLFAA